MLKEILFFIVDAIFELFDLRNVEREARQQEIAMKLLPLLLIGFIGVIFGIIWILEGGWS